MSELFTDNFYWLIDQEWFNMFTEYWSYPILYMNYRLLMSTVPFIFESTWRDSGDIILLMRIYHILNCYIELLILLNILILHLKAIIYEYNRLNLLLLIWLMDLRYFSLHIEVGRSFIIRCLILHHDKV